MIKILPAVLAQEDDPLFSNKDQMFSLRKPKQPTKPASKKARPPKKRSVPRIER